jgi:predicted flap endonuclease-1-like 5' DNA nuclease
MKAFRVFVFGLLYGLVLKYAVERIYRGNDMEDLRNENSSLMEYIRTLESQLQSRPVESKAMAQPAPVQAEPLQTKNERDNLKMIRGIGPAIEKRLNNAGVYTFEALAALSIAELENILGNARRLAQEDDLIAQAKKLARQNRR